MCAHAWILLSVSTLSARLMCGGVYVITTKVLRMQSELIGSSRVLFKDYWCLEEMNPGNFKILHWWWVRHLANWTLSYNRYSSTPVTYSIAFTFMWYPFVAPWSHWFFPCVAYPRTSHRRRKAPTLPPSPLEKILQVLHQVSLESGSPGICSTVVPYRLWIMIQLRIGFCKTL